MQNVKNEKVKCPICNKVRQRYTNKHDLCQVCYRDFLKKYSYLDYAESDKRYRGNTKIVLKKAVEDNLTPKEIANELKLNVTYVRMIIRQNTIKCDTYGNPMPKGVID